MNKALSIRYRILIAPVIATLLFSAALFYIANSIVSTIIADNLLKDATEKIEDISKNQQRIADRLLSQAALFSRTDQVLTAYQTAYSGDITNESDPKMEEARNELRAALASSERGYDAVYADQGWRIHFHLPPARSLLRLWQKKQNKSDDLSSFRNTIATISNGGHQPITGIEIGRGGFAIRGIAPVIDEHNKYYGSVEVLSNYDPLVTSSISSKKEYIAVYMHAKYLSIANRLQKNPVIGEKYVFISSTDSKVTDQLMSADILAQGEKSTAHMRLRNYYLAVFPIKDFSGAEIGIMAYVYDASKAYGDLQNLRLGILLMCVVLFFCILVPVFFSAAAVTKSINRTAQMVQDISAGDGDLRKRLDIARMDEIGILSSHFNVFLDNLQTLVRRVKESSEAISGASVEFTEIAEQLSQNTDDTSDRTSRLAQASEEMSTNISSIAAAMEESTTNITMVASATEEMAATINNISTHTAKANDVSLAAVGEADNASLKMEQLGDAASVIGKVTETITEISEQTNLLALNATIEAARAGEAGKGFAVVANEIKELAKQTAEATFDIKRQIEGIQATTGESRSAIDSIAQVIREVSAIVSEITVSVSEQSTATQEITNSIGQASSGLQEVNENINQNTTVVGEITQDIAQLDTVSSEISTSSTDLQNRASQLKAKAVDLESIVRRFKID